MNRFEAPLARRSPLEVDVLVAGGGSAGLAAAVSAARLGARTLLVDRYGALGGQAPAALVHTVCGLYLGGLDSPTLANGGFCARFIEQLREAGAAHDPVRMGRLWVLPHEPSLFSCAADAATSACDSLQVWLHTEMVSVSADGHANFLCRGKSLHVRWRTLIDATGDAEAAALLGRRCETSDSAGLQRPAFIFRLARVTPEAFTPEGRIALAHRIAAAVAAGALPPAAIGCAFRLTLHPGGAWVTADLSGGPTYAPIDPESLADLEREGRQLARLLTAWLKGQPGLESCHISTFPTRVGIRESRRTIGQTTLTAQDLEDARQPDDTVAQAAWPMELRETHHGPRMRYLPDGASAGIPLGTLRLKDCDRVFVAGRCISATHEAQASIRVIGTCMATGQAAGTAAALQALGGKCDAAEVRRHLDTSLPLPFGAPHLATIR